MAGKIIIGVGDIGLVRGKGEIIRTLGLGSCVALVLLDPKTHSIGMAHIALPEASVNQEKAVTKPGYFADTGVPALLDLMKRSGCDPNPLNYLVKLIGGAKMADRTGRFNIGTRNVLAVRKGLWQFGMGPVAEDVGGETSRSVSAFTDDGRVVITSPGRPDWEI